MQVYKSTFHLLIVSSTLYLYYRQSSSPSVFRFVRPGDEELVELGLSESCPSVSGSEVLGDFFGETLDPRLSLVSVGTVQ